jgi:putative ABC transport system substrate-binding protein
MISAMNRRQFITLLGGAAVAWPLAAPAQRAEKMRRIGVLSSVPADDAEIQSRMAAFHQGLQETGWIVGRNLRIDYRWSRAGDAEQTRAYADELIELAPEVILANASLPMTALQRATRTVPIVFTQVSDPVGAGFVETMARPGKNITGFMAFEFGLSAKWPELLKEIAPSVTRATVLRDPVLPGAVAQFAVMQSLAPSLGMELSPAGVSTVIEIERAVSAADKPNSGLIVLGGGVTLLHRRLIIGLAAKHRLPAVYPYRYLVADGGLISYGPDTIDQYRRAASYVDRILKGEKPADLPVQQPTKFEFVINLRTAKALGLTIPQVLLARADEVIE